MRNRGLGEIVEDGALLHLADELVVRHERGDIARLRVLDDLLGAEVVDAVVEIAAPKDVVEVVEGLDFFDSIAGLDASDDFVEVAVALLDFFQVRGEVAADEEKTRAEGGEADRDAALVSADAADAGRFGRDDDVFDVRGDFFAGENADAHRPHALLDDERVVGQQRLDAAVPVLVDGDVGGVLGLVVAFLRGDDDEIHVAAAVVDVGEERRHRGGLGVADVPRHHEDAEVFLGIEGAMRRLDVDRAVMSDGIFELIFFRTTAAHFIYYYFVAFYI
jgi:hypothetical protein